MRSCCLFYLLSFWFYFPPAVFACQLFSVVVVVVAVAFDLPFELLTLTSAFPLLLVLLLLFILERSAAVRMSAYACGSHVL